MEVNYLILGFTSLYLLGTFFYFRYTTKKGAEYRFKPLQLLVVSALFLLALYGTIVGKPYNEIVSFIG